MQCDKGRSCKTYTDGTDFRIENPPKNGEDPRDRHLPYDRKWYCYKFGSAGVRYLITTCIQTGLLVAIHGPFPCGLWPDIKIYKKYLKPKLEPNELVESDRGFPDKTVRAPGDYVCKSEKRAKSRVAARHEGMNGRIKSFKCMEHRFRHGVHNHKSFFCVAAVSAQMMYKQYGAAYDVSY